MTFPCNLLRKKRLMTTEELSELSLFFELLQ